MLEGKGCTHGDGQAKRKGGPGRTWLSDWTGLTVSTALAAAPVFMAARVWTAGWAGAQTGPPPAPRWPGVPGGALRVTTGSAVWPAVDADPRRPRPREHGARSPEEPSAPRENRRRDPPAIRRTDRPSLRQSGRLKGLSQGAEPRSPRCPVEFSVSEPDGQLAQRRRF